MFSDLIDARPLPGGDNTCSKPEDELKTLKYDMMKLAVLVSTLVGDEEPLVIHVTTLTNEKTALQANKTNLHRHVQILRSM